MEAIFNSYISNSLFFRPEQMYGENRKIFEELPYIVSGNIYFLAERRKVRALPESIKLSSDGRISVSFLLENGKTVLSCFPFAPTIIDSGLRFKQIYGDAVRLQKYIVSVQDNGEYQSKQQFVSSLPLIGVSLDRNAQTKKNVALRLHTPDGLESSLPFSLHSILSTFDIDIGDFPRVLYIGKSEHLTDRIYRHEKIQQALSMIDDDSDLYLYAFQFDTTKYIRSYLSNEVVVVYRDYVKDITDNDKLALVEMCLINYFKPELNKDYKDCDITINPVFDSALRGRYNRVVLEVDLGSGFWNFGTSHVSPSPRHQIEYPVHSS